METISGNELSTAKAPARLVSLDVFRGLTIAGMILVNDPGSWSSAYKQLLHAPWHGATATDMIFPAFLFIVGVSIPLSVAARRARGQSSRQLAVHAAGRAVVILALGLFLNALPDFHWRTLRLPGVLQRIAICYFCAALLYIFISRQAKNGEKIGIRGRGVLLASVSIGVLILYWMLLRFVPVPGFGPGRLDSSGSLPAYIDRLVFGTNHIWLYGITPGIGVTYDPEGLLSTIPAIVTVLIGIITGEGMRSGASATRKAVAVAAAGMILLLAGWLLHPYMPINKRIWTPTFVLFSGGVSLLVFTALHVLVDIRKSRWWTPPALVFGTNAIFSYALSSLIITLLDRLTVTAHDGSVVKLHLWAYQHLFASWISPVNASLAYAIAAVLLNLAIVLPLYRKRIFLRI